MYEIHDVIIAFSFTLFAGLSTGIGSIIGLIAKKTNTKFLAVSLGFSAGVMIYVSFVEILVKAKNNLIIAMENEVAGSWITVSAFFGGMLLIALIDKVIPKTENPHEIQKVEALQVEIDHTKKVNTLRRTGLFTALAIAIHNFPEGLATFMSALENPEVAIPITIAIAIHNIPEGIAVSVPIYYATGNRKKAFLYSFISGLSEPLGAIAGFFILLPLMSKMLMGIVFAAVAGIMVFISLDELLPASREYGEHHLSIYGLIAGMVIMSVSLLLFL